MQRIEVNHLSFAYGKSEEVISDMNFTAVGDETIGIIGANGVGKSTLLKLLVGLLLEYSGTIKVNDCLVCKKTVAQIRKQVGYVFQDADSQLFMPTVYEELAFSPRHYGYDEGTVAERVKETLQMVDKEALVHKPIHQLSGGEKRLIALATVLVMQPEFILLDEPSTMLDPRNRRNLIEVLNAIKGLKIIASHDLDMIWDTCDRILLIGGGRVIKEGRAEVILTDGTLLEANGLELPLSLSRHK